MGTSAVLPSLNGGGADDELVDASSVEDELGPDLLSLLQNGIGVERQREGLKQTLCGGKCGDGIDEHILASQLSIRVTWLAQLTCAPGFWRNF
jgi:hypothetical protein